MGLEEGDRGIRIEDEVAPALAVRFVGRDLKVPVGHHRRVEFVRDLIAHEPHRHAGGIHDRLVARVVVEPEAEGRALLNQLARARGKAIPLLARHGARETTGGCVLATRADDRDDVVMDDIEVPANLGRLHPDVLLKVRGDHDLRVDVRAARAHEESILHPEDVVRRA